MLRSTMDVLGARIMKHLVAISILCPKDLGLLPFCLIPVWRLGPASREQCWTTSAQASGAPRSRLTEGGAALWIGFIGQWRKWQTEMVIILRMTDQQQWTDGCAGWVDYPLLHFWRPGVFAAIRRRAVLLAFTPSTFPILKLGKERGFVMKCRPKQEDFKSGDGGRAISHILLSIGRLLLPTLGFGAKLKVLRR